MIKEFGQHYLVEYIDCDPEKLKYVEYVKEILLKAAHVSEATIVDQVFKQYEPYGVTGIILIAESHFSVHTWPEDRFVAFDILTCGTMYPEKAIEVTKQGFSANKSKVQIIKRGY